MIEVSGKMVKAARTDRKINQSAMAKLLNVSRATMVRIEKRNRIDTRHLEKINELWGSNWTMDTERKIAQTTGPGLYASIIAEMSARIEALEKRIHVIERFAHFSKPKVGRN